MKEIIIVVPSRGRPLQMKELIESWEKTTSGRSSILAGIDLDDPTVKDYPSCIDRAVYGEKFELNQKNNDLCNIGIDKGYPIVGCLSDDFIFHTPGWEDKIIAWQTKNWGICYGDDLLQGQNLPTAPFIHYSIIKALGFAAPRELVHYYIDNYWLELGIRLDKIAFMPDIVIEHKHWSNNKAVKDETYSNSESIMAKDRKVWEDYRLTKLEEDVRKVQLFQKTL